MQKKIGCLLLAISAFLAGNTDAWAVVYTHFEGDVRNIASLELGKSWDLDEDIVQETFLDAFRSRGRFPEQWDGTVSGFKRWLCAIARNRCRRNHAATKTRREVSLDLEDQRADSRSPCELLEVAEEVRVTLSELVLANSVGAQVLCLRVHGLSCPQVTALLGVKRQDVYKRKSQGAKRFRELYTQRQRS